MAKSSRGKGGAKGEEPTPITSANFAEHIIRALKEIEDPIVINRFHDFSDKNSDANAGHHSLGNNPEHSAQGDHTHDGQNGRKIFTPLAVGGSTMSNPALEDLLAKLAIQGIISYP